MSALALLACVAFGSACSGESPARPDLVLITVDRFATDRLPCFEGKDDPGDAVCALAEGGTLFAWTAASGAGEAAAAASVLTGMPPGVHGVADDGQSFLRDPNVTIAEELSQAGYATAAFVASPRVNRSRRLDQGFAYYDDRFASPERARLATGSDPAELDAHVRDWFGRTPSPRFVWIHLDRNAGRLQLDRLVSRLAEPLEMGADGPGVIFAGLRGETRTQESPDASAPLSRAPLAVPVLQSIDWRTHRVPLIWRPPVANRVEGETIPPVSRRLASLYDIRPTLRAAAAIPAPQEDKPSSLPSPSPSPSLSRANSRPISNTHLQRGRDLSQLVRVQPEAAEARSDLAAHAAASASRSQAPFFVLLEASGDQVGLAAQDHLYTRQRSPLDGTGRPVPTVSLEVRGARFSAIEGEGSYPERRSYTARLSTGPWRTDILSSDSPVPQLEYHLARRLDRPSENPTP